MWASSHLRRSCTFDLTYYVFYAISSPFLAATVSSNMIQYTVDEGTDTVQLQVVKIGSTNIPISVTVSTIDETAVG